MRSRNVILVAGLGVSNHDPGSCSLIRHEEVAGESRDKDRSLAGFGCRRRLTGRGLVDQAQLWRWGSLWPRMHGEPAIRALLSPWPVGRPANWTARVNTPLTAKEVDRVRVSIERGRPYGGADWVSRNKPRFGANSSSRRLATKREPTLDGQVTLNMHGFARISRIN